MSIVRDNNIRYAGCKTCQSVSSFHVDKYKFFDNIKLLFTGIYREIRKKSCK